MLIVLSLLYFVVEDTIAYHSLLLNLLEMSKQKRISALKDVIIYFTTFFASKFFPYFSPLKLGASYGPKNTVCTNSRSQSQAASPL